MAKVFIQTIPHDIHAAAASLVLERQGHQVTRWFNAEYPERNFISFAFGEEAGEGLFMSDGSGDLRAREVDVYWDRRCGAPSISTPLESGDRQFALRETTVVLEGAFEWIGSRAFSVNPPGMANRAENKAIQLATAREIGLDLPKTLISNDPVRVRRFLERYAEEGTIYKPLRPVNWESKDHVALLYTSKVESSQLPEDALLRVSPGIYQAYVPKAYEVRVTCMGHTLFPVRLDSQLSERGQVDWRLENYKKLSATPIELPQEVHAKCLVLMKRLGIVFGCIDLIVTPRGEHVFLEINQMGQFLWIEECCPELPILQTFCDFLVSKDSCYQRDTSRLLDFSFESVREESEAILNAEEGVFEAFIDQPHTVME